MELILDTNIYQALIKGLSEAEVVNLTNTIKTNCESKGHKILFPIHPAMELISHLNDKSEKARNICNAALKLLVNVSTTQAEGKLSGNYVPPLDSVLAFYVFGTEEENTKIYKNVIKLAQQIVGNVPLSDGDDIVRNTDIVKNQLNFEKGGIRDNYENYLKHLNGGEADWTYFKEKDKERKDFFKSLNIGRLSFLVAQSFIERAYTIAEKPIDKNEEYFRKVFKFMEDFAPALVMNELLLRKIGDSVEAIQDSQDDRWNTVIDISIIIGALYNSADTVRKLVTEEKNIHKAFANCGMTDRVMDLKAFKLLVGI